MTPFAQVFITALILTAIAKLWLATRHIRHVTAHREQVPAAFNTEISLEAHQKAADYSCAKTRLGMIGVLIETLAIVAFTFGGGLQALHDISATWFEPGVSRGVALIALVSVIMMLIDIPLSWYGAFVIEERFGFNKMTKAMFLSDLFKHAALAAALGVPLVASVLWVMAQAGTLWWLYAWLIWVTFNLLVLAVYPTWIAPIFNKFTPLNDVQLKARIDRLLDRCGFKVQGLMVMDGSRRSSHGNAYFTGFGANRRIVFFDTLLSRLKPEEVEAVLAHELGHFKLKHVIKRIVWIFATSLLMLWLLALIMDQSWFYQGLNVQSASTAMALILFFMALPQFTFLLQPLTSHYSRKHEFEADQYASRQAPASDLISALVKLYKDNASTLTPDPLHSMFYDSHPPAAIRIARLQQHALRTG